MHVKVPQGPMILGQTGARNRQMCRACQATYLATHTGPRLAPPDGCAPAVSSRSPPPHCRRIYLISTYLYR